MAKRVQEFSAAIPRIYVIKVTSIVRESVDGRGFGTVPSTASPSILTSLRGLAPFRRPTERNCLSRGMLDSATANTKRR